jgi:hypothetical protein
MAEELDARKIQLEEEIIMQKEEERRKEEALQERQRKLHAELDAEKRALSPTQPVQLAQPIHRTPFESRLQRKSFSLQKNPLYTSTIPLSARARPQEADYPILIPESSQTYSKSVESSPVIQPQISPNPTEFTLPDGQNTVIVPQ